MQKPKILLLDVDGTLVDYAGKIPPFGGRGNCQSQHHLPQPGWKTRLTVRYSFRKLSGLKTQLLPVWKTPLPGFPLFHIVNRVFNILRFTKFMHSKYCAVSTVFFHFKKVMYSIHTDFSTAPGGNRAYSTLFLSAPI